MLFVPEQPGLPSRYAIKTMRPGVHPFVARVWAGDFERVLTGTLVDATWQVTFFKWTERVDPRKDLDGWRKLATGETAVETQVKQLRFKYAGGGPKHSRQPSLAPTTSA